MSLCHDTEDARTVECEMTFETRHDEWQVRIGKVRSHKLRLGRNIHPHELDSILEPAARPGRWCQPRKTRQKAKGKR